MLVSSGEVSRSSIVFHLKNPPILSLHLRSPVCLIIYLPLLQSMELHNDYQASMVTTRKRKFQEEDTGMEQLNQDLLERILSWLPTSAFFRLTSVSKRWKAAADSSSFRLACSQVPRRDPWFFMVDHPHLNHSIVFDSAEHDWKKLNHPPNFNLCNSNIPVAASGGLICFRNIHSGILIVCNPVTGSYRQLPPPPQNQSLHAIAMNSSSHHSSYKLVLVSGELPNLSFKSYDSSADCWEQDTILQSSSTRVNEDDTSPESDSVDHIDSAVYFLSKAGNVVATNMQRSPSKQYSSLLITRNNDGLVEEILYFLSPSGTIVACNLARKCFSEYPRLLPVSSEYSIDVVDCRGEMLVVVLSEFLESASLRVWRFDEDSKSWRQIAAMPPAMSHEFYGKKVDINCVGAGHKIFICFSSAQLFRYLLCDLVANDWVELPNCSINGQATGFMSAFSFEPRIEASV